MPIWTFFFVAFLPRFSVLYLLKAFSSDVINKFVGFFYLSSIYSICRGHKLLISRALYHQKDRDGK
ncbi:hypothetical protein D3Y59_17800 (plasmid) [Hymenobacter oligotrophus]|uniref:Uncharacterized protein n=1 Tax=Hymenobacter oligotrophus TaxID=2319843 RepID=A0A3B7RIE8_9BACT|nr:hypothetical protein D3Y59_17800 [Hymenobacter oligotrophus]